MRTSPQWKSAEICEKTGFKPVFQWIAHNFYIQNFECNDRGVGRASFLSRFSAGEKQWLCSQSKLSGVQFGLKSYAWFQTRTSSIRNHKYDFRPKLHDMKFNSPLYYIYFEITQQEKVKINSFVYKGAGLLENVKFLQQSLQNFPSKMFPVFFLMQSDWPRQ